MLYYLLHYHVYIILQTSKKAFLLSKNNLKYFH